MRRMGAIVALVSVLGLPLAPEALAQAGRASQPAQPRQPGYEGSAASRPAASQKIQPVEDPKRLGLWRGSAVIGQNDIDAVVLDVSKEMLERAELHA